MTFRVLHHNQCFDGACSAAMFTKLHRECLGGASGYEYRGLAHSASGEVSEEAFGAGENAIVDFKYSRSARLTWWFDHHLSGFPTAEDRADFEATRGEGRKFFDAEAVSCTGFIAEVGKSRFAFNTAGLEELLHWADIVDGARFASATMAVEMKEPALKLAMCIENAEGSEFIPRVIPLLTSQSLDEIVAEPFVSERIGPLMEKHRAAMELVREKARLTDSVLFMDLLDRETEAISKFIPYYYYPEAIYTVAVSRSKSRTKISVGTNPWTTRGGGDLANIAGICERFGGGGHARVGAISFGSGEVERARSVAEGIVRELRGRE